MHYFIKIFKRLFHNSNVRDMTTVAIIFFSTSMLFGYYMHNYENLTIIDTIYYLAVTSSTVGYGDISPKTDIGKVLLVMYLFISISTVGILLSRIGEKMMNISHKSRKGIIKVNGIVDLIIVGYPQEEKVREIVEQLRNDVSYAKASIVCITNQVSSKPEWFAKYNVKFVYGIGSDIATLRSAGIMTAKKALVLASDPTKIESDDASSSAITIIEKLNPNVHTIVERVRQDALLFESSGCDVVARISSPEVIAREILDPGAFEFENAVFSNDVPGTQYNITYEGEDIPWKELAMKIIMMGCIPEGFKLSDDRGVVFQLLPSPNDIVPTGSVVKYRSWVRLDKIK